jgi:gas vesicle protein
MRSLEKTNDGFNETSYIMTKMLAYFSDNRKYFADAMTYLRWNLTNTIQNLSDDDLAEFIEEHIIKQSRELKAVYKKNKEINHNKT